MYCAMATRLRHLREKVKEIARRWGYAPVIPFEIGALEDFEKGIVGREGALDYMLYINRYPKSDTGVFMISDGAMGEFRDALDSKKEIRVDLSLDPEWEKYYDELKPKYGDLFARLRGSHHLIVLVGPRAVGKTFWSERLLRTFPFNLKRVKNTTTRAPRDEKDHESYNFVSREEFEQGIREDRFLEYDQYQGNYYGSSFEEIKRVLKKNSGIFAITPAGAKALYERRFEINLKIVQLAPHTQEVLKRNFQMRPDIKDDPVKQNELLEDAKNFTLPEEMDHEFALLTGDADLDGEKIISIMNPLFNKKTAP